MTVDGENAHQSSEDPTRPSISIDPNARPIQHSCVEDSNRRSEESYAPPIRPQSTQNDDVGHIYHPTPSLPSVTGDVEKLDHAPVAFVRSRRSRRQTRSRHRSMRLPSLIPKGFGNYILVRLPWSKSRCSFEVKTQLTLLLLGTSLSVCVNLLFVAVPAGFIMNYAGINPIATFCVNFIAIIPSARVLGYAVDDICMPGRAQNSVGTIINNSFRYVSSYHYCMTTQHEITLDSNAVQLISAIFLLRARLTTLVHLTLMGSIFSNLLLMTGLGFLLGGLHPRRQQKFNANLAQTIGMLLLLATLSLIIPTASKQLTSITDEQVALQSRGTAIVILISYCLWLWFQLGPDCEIFKEAEEGADAQSTDKISLNPEQDSHERRIAKLELELSVKRMPATEYLAQRDTTFPTVEKLLLSSGSLILMPGADFRRENGSLKKITDHPPIGNTYQFLYWLNQQHNEPCMDVFIAIVIIAASTTLIGFNTEYATNSVQQLLEQTGLSQYFVGLIILPLLSCEPASITYARANRLDLSISLTLDRCMQTALMVVPLIVLLAWVLGIPGITLQFDPFVVVAVFVSIVIVTYVVQEGKSNW